MAAHEGKVDWTALEVHRRRQCGLVTRAQCLAAGMTHEMIRSRVRSGRWIRRAAGVHLTTPGRTGWDLEVSVRLLAAAGTTPLADPGHLHATVPYPRVALYAESAARAWNWKVNLKAPLVLAVPAHRVLTPTRGVTIRRIPDWERRVDPVEFPWRTTKAATVLDCAASGTPDGALAWLAQSVRDRLVPTVTLRQELAARQRIRHGVLMREALDDIVGGAHSAAEVRYVRDVEGAHHLPVAQRQVASRANGRSVHDNVYEAFGLVIEVDGRLGHEEWSDRVRDGRRDRQAVREGRWTSRVFWTDVAVTPCDTAGEVGALLRGRGWTGAPSRCRRRHCSVPNAWV